MTQLVDDHETITIHVHDGRVEQVIVRPTWKQHYEPRELASTITALLSQETASQPAARASVTIAHDASRPPMTLDQTTAFWNEFHAYRSLMAARRNRLLSGDRRGLPPAELEETDVRHRVGAVWVRGRFQSMGFDPEWIADAPAQTISQTVTQVLSTHPLVIPVDDDPEWDRLQDHKAAMNAILAGK